MVFPPPDVLSGYARGQGQSRIWVRADGMNKSWVNQSTSVSGLESGFPGRRHPVVLREPLLVLGLARGNRLYFEFVQPILQGEVF
jgi:hypothetical protein